MTRARRYAMCLLTLTVMLAGFAAPARAQTQGQTHTKVGQTLVWSGKGDVGPCEFGYQLVLTPGGKTTITNATLDVGHVVAKAGPGAWHFWIGPGHTQVTVTFDWTSKHADPNFQFVASRCLDAGEFPGVPPAAPVNVTVTKAWVVVSDPDSRFDPSTVSVGFLVNGSPVANGGTLVVSPGTMLDLMEQVTGFPPACDYVPKLNGNTQLVHLVGNQNETITITNEVTCPAITGPPGPSGPDDVPVVPPPVGGADLAPAVRLDKDVDVAPDADGVRRVVLTDDADTVEVTFVYRITNEGATTLTLLELTDDRLDGVDVTIFDTDTLAPGESATGSYTTTLSAADFDEDGRHRNVAVVRAAAPDGQIVTDEDDLVLDLIEVRDVTITPERPDDVAAERGEVVPVVEEAGMLPVTGGSITRLLMTGIVLLLLGAGLLMMGRRMPARATSGAHADTPGNAAATRRTTTPATSGADLRRRGPVTRPGSRGPSGTSGPARPWLVPGSLPARARAPG